MSDCEFTIRLATGADVDALTELHLRSFRPDQHVPVLLGGRYVHATYRWLVSSDMTYVLVAETDKGFAGLISVADRSFTRPMFRYCLKEFMLAILGNPLLLVNRSLWQRLFRQSSMTPEGQRIADHPAMAQMTIGAVDSGHRGLGVFPALVEATRSHSRARGARGIRAGVYRSNSSSLRVFVKSGWTEIPALQAADTVFFVAFLDRDYANELGITQDPPES